MKKVFLKGIALATIVAFSFANVSCEQKTETSVEAASEELEAAEAHLDATVEDAQQATTEEAIDANVEAVEDATDATQDAAEDVKDAVQNEVK